VTSPTSISLAELSSCFEGIIPSIICTVGDDGMPNITYLSVVHRVDDTHVALSRQFFRKTDENTQVNPAAQVSVIDPDNGRIFNLDLDYERTETEGPLFERMRTRLDAVAAHEGMANVFVLKGVDICRVLGIRMLPSDAAQGTPRRIVNLEKVEAFSARVASIEDMDELLEVTLNACAELGYRHGFVMLVDETGEKLYTVASHGYTSSGAGSEVRVGEGLIGVAAARRQSVRLTQFTRDRSYSQASREAAPDESRRAIETVIPLPGLPSVQSELVTPMLAYRKLVGMLCFQSPIAGAFRAEDECIVGIIANQVAMAMARLQESESAAAEAAPGPEQRPVQVKHFSEDDSVFIDNEYLIKGVAGAILWRLLRTYQEENRVDFSNKEIRLDQTLDLPDIKDNLEARLVLLRRRLEERYDWLRIERTARGRFRLVVSRPVKLVPAEGDAQPWPARLR
jgi:adenylate cyclase